MTTPQPYRPLGSAPAGEQSRAVSEIEAAVIVAQRNPRDIARAEAELRDVCGRLPMAEQAFYQLPGTPNRTGPSVHLMRECARIWGNNEHGSNEVKRDDARGESEVQAFAWDTQSNTRTSRTFVAPHARMRNGLRQNLVDLSEITNNNNNVAARAVRECISNVLPRWFTEMAQDLCRETLERGDGEPLPQRIERIVQAFNAVGVTQKQMESRIGKARARWVAVDLAQLSIDYTSVTRDNLDPTEVFPKRTTVSAADLTAPAEPDPVTRAQMDTIASLRKVAKVNIKDWVAHINSTLTTDIVKVSDLTEPQAQQFIAIERGDK